MSIYKPTDLWTRDDDLLFLKYCPDIRIRCYHTISRDLSARPSEILDLRIKDIMFKTAGDKQYAECLVNGKTGTRHLPLINSLPYVKDWLDHHPARNNSNSHLICSMDAKNFAGRMTRFGIHRIYSKRYKGKFFPDLLKNLDLPAEDKDKIRELLRKPWNPYARRHSALTEKSKFLREHTLRQHAGWSGRSQMHLRYLHYFGNESNNSILQEFGILPKDNVESDVLRAKQCPNCGEPNKPDSKFCAKCRMVLTYDAYSETIESEKKKQDRLMLVEERLNTTEQMLQQLIVGMEKITDQHQLNTIAQSMFSSGILKIGPPLRP